MYPDDPVKRFTIETELEKFKRSEGLFGSDMAKFARDKKQPAHWWELYGEGESKKFAVRILSLTCSATGCERNWSVFDHIHCKRRAKLEHERLSNIVFVKYNLKLERRQRLRELEDDHYDPIELSDMESDDEWLIEKEGPVLQGESVSDIEAQASVRKDPPPINFTPEFSWMYLSECLMEEDVGASSRKKRKRGPRDLRLSKEKDGNDIRRKGKTPMVQEEPELEEESETSEEDEGFLNLDDGSDSGSGSDNDDDLDDILNV